MWTSIGGWHRTSAHESLSLLRIGRMGSAILPSPIPTASVSALPVSWRRGSDRVAPDPAACLCPPRCAHHSGQSMHTGKRESGFQRSVGEAPITPQARRSARVRRLGGPRHVRARPCAEQGFAGDGEQRPLVPRSRSWPKWRPYVVPSAALPDSLVHPGCLAKSAETVDLLPEVGSSSRQRTPSRPRNYSWAELLHRVLGCCPGVPQLFRTHENR